MKNILKNFYLLYQKIFNSFVSIISVVFFSSFQSNRQISKCKVKFKKHNESIILGNGPSITDFLKYNNDFLLSKDIFVVNFFCTTPYFNLIKPSFYILLDPFLFLEDSASESKIDLIIDKLNDVNWEIALFVPANVLNSSILNKIVNLNIKKFGFNPIPVSGCNTFENFIYSQNLGMPLAQTVINAAIFIAINLDYHNVHLFGVEQSWLKFLTVHQDNQISVGLNHFYTGADKTRENRTLSEFLKSQVAVFESHLRLEKYSKFKNVKIYNHTIDSYIDAYERKVF